MAAAVHTFGGVALLESSGYGVVGIDGFSSPLQQLDKQRKAQQDGEAIQRAWRPNANRSVDLVVQGTSKSSLTGLIQALEQETVGISQDNPLVYQYTPQDGSTVNLLDVYAADITYSPDKQYEQHNDALVFTITMETSPSWQGPWTWVGTTNLLPYVVSTLEESDPTVDPTTGFSAEGSGTISIIVSTSNERSGNWALNIVPDGAAADQGVRLNSPYAVRATPGKDYVLSAFVRKTDGTPATTSIKLQIQGFTSDGVATQSANDIQDIPVTYTRMEATFTAAADVAFIRFKIAHNGTSSENFIVDDIMLEEGTVASAFAVPATTIEPQNNFLTDNQASIETDTTGFTIVSGSAISVTTDEQKFDSSSLEVITTGAGDGWYSESAVLDNWRLTGQDWTYSVWMKHGGASPGGDFDVTLVIQQRNGGAGPSGTLAAQTITDTWTRYEVSQTVAAGGTVADRFRCQVTQDNAGVETFYADGQMLQPAAAATTFTMPGPLIGQDSFNVSGDLPTEISLWTEPVGDFTSEVYAGLHNQNTEGQPELVFDAGDNTVSQVTVSSTEADVFLPAEGSNTFARYKGTYLALVQLTASAAASDYTLQWRINQPNTRNFDGPSVKVASQITPQWVTLGVVTFPPSSEPAYGEEDYFDCRFAIRGTKASSTGIMNVWRVVLVPTDNGAVFQSGVNSGAQIGTIRTLLMNTPGSLSIGYQLFSGGFTAAQSWPSGGMSDEATPTSANFSPFVAGPGTVDMVQLLKENSQSLLKSRWVAGYFPQFLSPVQ